jgi:hypothetical protein
MTESITCEQCKTQVGMFKIVARDNPIKVSNFAIQDGDKAKLGPNTTWVCANDKCNNIVVARLVQGIWSVHTPRGWLQVVDTEAC